MSTLEGLGIMFDWQYQGAQVFVIVHTCFKSSWLAYCLTQLGGKASGYALMPDNEPNHWDLLKLDMTNQFDDICEYQQSKLAFTVSQTEIVFHLAAQSLLRKSYHDPLDIRPTNVKGIANLLEACKNAPSVRAVLVVITDKRYEKS